MRRGGGHGVEDLATGGLLAHKVVPSSFPKQGGSSRPPPTATCLWEVDAPICCGLEIRERLLRLGGTRRFTGRRFAISLGPARGLARVVGYALLFWRLVDRAGACHQAG